MSYKKRVAATFIALNALVAGAIGWLVIGQLSGAHQHDLEMTEGAILVHVSDIALPALLKEDYGELQFQLDHLADLPGVDALYVVDALETVVASSGFGMFGEGPGQAGWFSDSFWVEQGVHGEHGRIGAVFVAFNRRGLQAVTRLAWSTVALIAAAGIAVFATLALLAAHWLTDPLQRLANAVQSFGEHGTFEPLPEAGSGLLTDLSRSFNCMARRVEATVQQLRRSERRFRQFAEAAGDWYWEADEEGRYTFIAASTREVDPLPAALYLGRMRWEVPGTVVPPDSAIWEHHQQDLKARRPFHGLRFIRWRPDGRKAHVETSGKPVYDEAGNFQGWCGVARDVSVEIERQQQIEASEAKFRNLIEGSLEGIIIIQDGKPAFVNQAAFEMFGYESIADFLSIDDIGVLQAPHERPRLGAQLAARVRGEAPPEQFEFDGLRKDGTQIRLQAFSRAVGWDGRPAVQSTLLDITESWRTNARLQRALLDVSELNRQLESEKAYLLGEIQLHQQFEEIVGRSAVMHRLLGQVEQVAHTDSTVLILGESGTGKELVANAIHRMGPRADTSLVKVNCAALPDHLVESELFGHEKGAFTGAHARKIGRVELADGGTIFLDEIGELPMASQSKLLRFLQEGEFHRLGGTRTVRVDVRVIAATNQKFPDAVKDGTFREDLFYRLNVFPIHCPPLRERKEDIPELVNHYLRQVCGRIGRPVPKVPRRVMAAYQDYGWPGNIRELANVVERAVILTRGGSLFFDEGMLRSATSEREPDGVVSLRRLEASMIRKALEESNWTIGGKRGAAAKLDLPPSTLRERMKKYGIVRPHSQAG